MHPVKLPDAPQPDVVEKALLATDAELNGIFLEPVLHGALPGQRAAGPAARRRPDRSPVTWT